MNKYKEKLKKIELIETTQNYTEFVEEFETIRDWAVK